ncbi:sigma-54-dependent transcriptional regulator [Legionella sp. W05-934-2]|uniref:sigma-54-dependent transcriptional regulator n=1 Tax=Legionella sp. W05-934-2 TaxID=1198649 RepID=UPI003461D5DA
MSKSVCVIDDEPDICELLTITLHRMGLKAESYHTFKTGLDAILANDYSLILTDMRLPDGDGIDLVRKIQKHKPHIPVAVITAYGNVEGAVNSLKAGAFDYVSKPVNLPMLKDLVTTAISIKESQLSSVDEKLIGNSVVMLELKKQIDKVARSQAPVFIKGESGVGKELVAKLIHSRGPRQEKPFIPVNCGAIPAELMESEFFGHVKGSFTGAIENKIGLFEAAHGGTLFLDEIAELPIAMQVKLLRAIQEKAIKPVGSNQEKNVDVRILSASHKDLMQAIQQGSFRQDLYYRINVITLFVPPLRERQEDIPLLAKSILAKLCKGEQRPMVTLDGDCVNSLKKYRYPGNVRELENILERAIALCENNTITRDDLDLPVLANREEEPLDLDGTLDEALNERERHMIIEALEKTKWNRTAAAKLLGLSLRTLRYRIQKLGIE